MTANKRLQHKKHTPLTDGSRFVMFHFSNNDCMEQCIKATTTTANNSNTIDVAATTTTTKKKEIFQQ